MKINEKNKLKQVQKKVRERLVTSLCCLIFLSILGISYILLNSNTNEIYSVEESTNELLVYVDGEQVSEFPSKAAGYLYETITCKNNSVGTWDDTTWSLSIEFSKNDACIVYFVKPYTETLLAGSDPVLDSKMVPVNISDTGVVTVADIFKEWYNYNNKEWANAVIVDPTFTTLDSGTTIPMDKIEQMYVWIPRYEYDAASIESAAHAIDVTFVDKTQDAHPAFTFGTDELSGIWVGKFEQGEDNTIRPNQNSIHLMNVSTLYDNVNNAMTTYSLDATTDVHMIKNTEWGAVAYLSQSKYGVCNSDGTCSAKIENNNYYNNTSWDVVTGCGGTDVNQPSSESGIAICPVENRWTTENGVEASTTHNITGIYDMAGGRNEYVMGNMQDSSGNFYSRNSGFTTAPDSKYYDSYAYGTSDTDYNRGLPGDATIELNPSGVDMSNWNNDTAAFLNSITSWFLRGGPYLGSYGGIWYFNDNDGYAGSIDSTRSVLSSVY